MRRCLLVAALLLAASACGEERGTNASPPPAAAPIPHDTLPVVQGTWTGEEDLDSLLQRLDLGPVPLVWPTWPERIAAHGSRALPELTRRTRSDGPRTRALALECLLALMNANERNAREDPAKALTPEQCREVVELLLAAVSDPDEDVRGVAECGIIALTRCPPSMACDLVGRAAKDDAEELHLQRLLSRTFPDAWPLVLACLDRMATEARPAARERTCRALDMHGGAMDELIAVLPDASPQSQVQATDLLVEYPLSPAAGRALRDLTTSDDARVREAAARGLETWEERRSRMEENLEALRPARQEGAR